MRNFIPEQERIQKLLKINSRGLTVGEISKELNLNRNSVAKYLELLLIEGNVEKRTIGPAKLYFPSKKIPILKLLNYASEGILVLDDKLNIIQANNTIITYLKQDREEVLGKNIYDLDIYALDSQDFLDHLKTLVSDSEFGGEYSYIKNGKRKYVRYKILNSCFGRDLCGKVLMFEDITSQKEYENKLKFDLKFENLISQIAIEFIYVKKEEINNLIQNSIKKIANEANVDNSFIYLFNKNRDTTYKIYKWSREENLDVKDISYFPTAGLESWLETLTKFDPVICYYSKLKKEFIVERAFMEKYDIKTFILYPLMHNGDLVGFYGFSNKKENRYWKNSTSLLNTAGRIFVEVMKKNGVLDQYYK